MFSEMFLCCSSNLNHGGASEAKGISPQLCQVLLEGSCCSVKDPPTGQFDGGRSIPEFLTKSS